MRLNPHLYRINRSFLVSFAASAGVSAVVAQLLAGHESYLNTTVTIAVGYVVYFGIFSCLFYLENRRRYRTMSGAMIRRELAGLASSFGVGEVVYLGTRWPTFYYFLEADIEPYLASLASEVIATACYMAVVTVFLRKTRTF